MWGHSSAHNRKLSEKLCIETWHKAATGLVLVWYVDVFSESLSSKRIQIANVVEKMELVQAIDGNVNYCSIMEVPQKTKNGIMV